MLGILVLALAGIGLFCWKSKQSAPTVTTQSATVTAASSAPPPPPPMLYAPPPPPKIDEEPDAGADAGKQVAKGPGGSGTGAPAGLGPCGGKCEGQSTPALSSALRSKAQSATGCYQRALRTSEVSGSMTVSVQVSSTGSVCSASLVNDSVHSAEVASCVLSRFRGQSFPPPSGGCVTANIPISFTIKQ